ncbi:hypothetical protein [Paenibacillus aestuarii]|uniref:DUF4440 domain-containing protein n=1 Tax=Paenibacillus aestuarii TaxID=516965 RepID=A0ABW0K9C7_9BACL|nr:hypothetical protein [Paenibacillus aestuarii]
MQKHSFFAQIRRRLFGEDVGALADTLLIEEPEKPLEDEYIQGTEVIQLAEQLQMIRIVDEHTKQFVFTMKGLDPAWVKGFVLQNEIFVTQGEEPVYRSNMEVFYQDGQTGEKKMTYQANLIRFADDSWRVFQVKGVMPSSK